MADDTVEDDDERAIELSSVKAIYPELEIDEGGYAATIDLQVEPVPPLAILFPTLADGVPPLDEQNLRSDDHAGGQAPIVGNSPGDRIQNIYHLSHLPPLALRMSLPDGYPSENPPEICLGTQYSWLPQYKVKELRDAAHTIWEEMSRDQVVFSYIDHLREAAEKGFDLAQGGKILEVPADLKVSLLDFDIKARHARFDSETFECGICLEPKKGSVCHRLLLCSHVFCVACLQEFYNSCITEGDIRNVKCMAPKCGIEPREPMIKADSDPEVENSGRKDKTLEPSELLQIPLEQEIVQRYVKLKRKKRLESDRSTVYCPRQWCQGPARTQKSKRLDGVYTRSLEENPGDEADEPQSYDRNAPPEKLPPPAERLAICEDCTFAFCKVCKASWHGEYFTCFPRSRFELTAEEKASEDYMKLHTQPCPTCDARAQKTQGCNHMICFKCDTHFCYLCGAYLDKANPYAHFNNMKISCYMRLWELEGGDDGEFGQGFGGGARGLPMDFDDDEEEEEEEDQDFAPPAAPEPPPAINLRPPAQHMGGQAARPQRARQGAGPRQNQNLALAAVPQPIQQNADPRPNGNRGAGLQRFLQMVQDDEEDEWDSDEMEENDDELGNLD